MRHRLSRGNERGERDERLGREQEPGHRGQPEARNEQPDAGERQEAREGHDAGEERLLPAPDEVLYAEPPAQCPEGHEPGHDLPDGFVHSESLWLVEGETCLGRASLRHTLNERLREFGGHIGYEIRPSARRQGHGRTILRLTLQRARALGLERVLVTCDTDNLGSRGVIEGNGGVLEGEFMLADHPKPLRRYWITPGAQD